MRTEKANHIILQGDDVDIDDDFIDNARPFLMGKAAAVVNEKKSAKAIVDEMVQQAVDVIQQENSFLVSKSKL